MKFFEEEVEEARASHPRLVEEFERLRLWVFTCLGKHVAMPGGPSVEAPVKDHVAAVEALNAGK